MKTQNVGTVFSVTLLLTILFLSYLSIAQGFKNGPPKPTETVTVVCYGPSIFSMNKSVTISTHSPARIVINLGTYGTQDVVLIVGRNRSIPDNPSQVQITDDLPPICESDLSHWKIFALARSNTYTFARSCYCQYIEQCTQVL